MIRNLNNDAEDITIITLTGDSKVVLPNGEVYVFDKDNKIILKRLVDKDSGNSIHK